MENGWLCKIFSEFECPLLSVVGSDDITVNHKIPMLVTEH